MTGLQIFGALLVALPLVATVIMSVIHIGWRATVGNLAIVALTVGLIIVGTGLLTGGIS